MAADETLLSKLHNLVTKDLIARIESGEATAADLAVARGLLKDNHITCIPAEGSAVNELEKKLQERRAKRQVPRLSVVPSDDIAGANADREFLISNGE